MGKSQSKKLTSEANDESYVRFALIGSSGCGKSAFVNTVRGIDDEDHHHSATVDVVETQAEPIEYTYPTNPRVSFCDFPGYGTPSYPSLEIYYEQLKLQNFDQFLIFLSHRVTQLDLTLIEKVKSANKSYFLIRTKIDIEHRAENRKRNFKGEEMLSRIRNYILKQTNHLACTEKDIFLISNYDPYEWEFFQLIQAIINLFPVPVIDKTADLTEQYMADAREYVRNKGVANIEEFLRNKLRGSKDMRIRFGITGDGGAGKSAFINAIRGLKDDDEGAAEVDVVESTTKPTEYEHPSNPKIIFVDLPGIGTPNYPNLPTYCEDLGLKDYDAFLIFTSTRFTNNDLELAKKFEEIGKSFFLVRTKIDDDLTHKKGRKPSDEEEILNKIKNNCFENVKNLLFSKKDIFLISNYDPNKWDFDRLIVAIIDALPILQRECLTLSLTNVTRECLKRKVKFFRAQAALVAVISAGTGAIPVPGLGCAIDTAFIATTLKFYQVEFGLGKTTQKELQLLNKKCQDVIIRYQVSSVLDLLKSVVTKNIGVLLGVEEVSKFIPIFGSLIAGSISFATTFYFLNRSIKEMEEVALSLWDNAAKRAVQEASRDNPQTQ